MSFWQTVEGNRRTVVAVKEASQFFGVRMQVKDEASLFPCFLNFFLDMVDGRRGVLGWFLPDSVGIYSGQLCSRIAVNNSIRIDHWNDLEDIVIVKRVVCLNCLYH